MNITTAEAEGLIREWHEQGTVLVFGVASCKGNAGRLSVAVRDCRIEETGDDILIVASGEPPACTSWLSLAGAACIYNEGRELNSLLLKDNPQGKPFFSHDAKLLTLCWEAVGRTIVLQEQEHLEGAQA